MRNPIVLAIGVVLALAACGTSSTSDVDGDVVPASSTETAGTTVSTTTSAVPEAIPEECTTDRKTLEVAVEAYNAQNGVYPTRQDELLVGRYLWVEFDSYDVGPDGAVVRVAGVPCNLEDEPESDAMSQIPTVDEIVARIDPDLLGGPECTREFAVFASAGGEFEDTQGRGPEDLDELTDFLSAPITLWRFDDVEEGFVPAEGSPCRWPFGGDD